MINLSLWLTVFLYNLDFSSKSQLLKHSPNHYYILQVFLLITPPTIIKIHLIFVPKMYYDY